MPWLCVCESTNKWPFQSASPTAKHGNKHQETRKHEGVQSFIQSPIAILGRALDCKVWPMFDSHPSIQLTNQPSIHPSIYPSIPPPPSIVIKYGEKDMFHVEYHSLQSSNHTLIRIEYFLPLKKRLANTQIKWNNTFEWNNCIRRILWHNNHLHGNDPFHIRRRRCCWKRTQLVHTCRLNSDSKQAN